MKTKFLIFIFAIVLFTPVFFARADVLPLPDASTTPDIIPPPDASSTPILTENILIRNGDTVIFQGSVDLPTAGNIDIMDNASTTHSVNTDSVLGVLYSLDQNNDSFSISNLQYYDSFGAFYLKCITSVSESCDNWQYVVGGTTPWQSIDQTILTGGESIGIYFGTPYKVVLNSNNIHTTDTLNVTAEKYDYENNVWNPRTGVTVGLTQPDPNNPWSPIEVQTIPVDASGVATFTNIGAGNYNVGIQEDYYFPTESLTVSAPFVDCGCGGGNPAPVFSIPNAISYLESVQSSDGSFGDSDMYTDWASIALSANGISNNIKNKILSYMSADNSVSDNLTDNERRAMALLALNKNPYDFGNVDYITPIINSFDGTQFGDTNLINDDIFALIPLANTGYDNSDDIIKKDIAYVISKQKINGSWEESVDMTSASILALENYSSVSGVNSAISLAENYLESSQKNDGGWGNVSATSWVLQAESILGTNWSNNGKTGIDYLADNQDTDGGAIKNTEILQNRIWATSYAIPGALNETWNQIFHSFPKPTNPTNLTQTCETDPSLCTPPIQPTCETNITLCPPKSVLAEEKLTIVPVENITPKVVSVKKVEKKIEPKILTKEISKIEPINITATAGNSDSKISMIVSIFSLLGLIGLMIFRFVI
ncbi:MAG: terpene cyclase/mutase family protein [Candidatus Nomurabacteria bacterium]|nr:terpene cyclase/mutase family protein [Candidatus Nomurabacteria bacterium]